MVMSKPLCKTIVLLLTVCLLCVNSAWGQVLPVLNRFSGRTFDGTVDVPGPALYDDCTFRTDSVVLRRSYGAVFRNCSFESRSGVLYLADAGDGMILSDCELKGCGKLMFSRNYTKADRNYVTGITVNGDECQVLDDQEYIIDIDGLELAEAVRGNVSGPVFAVMGADKRSLKGGETAVLQVRGLEQGMFMGWMSSDPEVELKVGDDSFSCSIKAPESIGSERDVVISAYTEYGLEAACVITLMADVRKKKR